MNLIKQTLESKGVKQTWLADQIGKSYNMINSYVQNRRQPSLDSLFRIAEILQVQPSQLIDDSKSIKRSIRGNVLVNDFKDSEEIAIKSSK